MEYFNYGEKELPDGRYIYLDPMTYGKVRLCVAPEKDSEFYDDGY